MHICIFIKLCIYIIISILFQVSLATFGTYIFVSSDHYLDAKKAFVALSLFNILRVAINFAPMAVNKTIKVNVI